MDEIVMRHPELGVEKTFPASSRPIYAASGWQVVDPSATSPEPPPVTMSAEEAMAAGREPDQDTKTAKTTRRAGTQE